MIGTEQYISFMVLALLIVVHSPVFSQKISRAAISITGLNRPGDTATTSGSVVLTIEEHLVTQTFPLLPYIFFSSGSARIDTRYDQLSPVTAKEFTDKDLSAKLARNDTLGVYRAILNIIGRRMAGFQDTITLTGCTAAEKGGDELARQRAESVRDYLHRVWGIPNGRMIVHTRGLPQKRSIESGDGEGSQENRRVEFQSDNLSILQPVVLHDTTRTATPPVIRFNLAAQTPAGFQEYYLEATQRGRSLYHSANDKLPSSVEWIVGNNRDSIPSFEDSIRYSLKIRGKGGKGDTASASGSFFVNQLTITRKRRERIGDREYDVYRLILFDFGRDKLGREHKAIIDSLVHYIRADSDSVLALKIIGYTDHIGSARSNRELASGRAKAVEKEILRRGIAAFPSAPWEVVGVGEGETESQLLRYDNQTPEGRFYSRTVEIWVERRVHFSALK